MRGRAFFAVGTVALAMGSLYERSYYEPKVSLSYTGCTSRVDGKTAYFEDEGQDRFRYRRAKLRRAKMKSNAQRVKRRTVKMALPVLPRVTQPPRNHCCWRRPG